MPAFTKPLAILGVEGIYDLVALRDNHAEGPYYQRMIENVFGTDEVSLRRKPQAQEFISLAGLVGSMFPRVRRLQ